VFQLFRIKPERLGLPTPLGRWIAEPLDTDAAGQAALVPGSRASAWILVAPVAAIPMWATLFGILVPGLQLFRI
jgi:hypothetical protein